jgi:GTPase SAR1 family protein
MALAASIIRRGLAVLAVLGTLMGGYFLLQVGRELLAFWAQLQALPDWLQWLAGLLMAVLAGVGAMLLWVLLTPAKQRIAPSQVLDRKAIEGRLAQLEAMGSDTSAWHHELTELDKRASSGRLYVAFHGDISSGKTRLLKALVPSHEGTVDVRGGSTERVHYAEALIAAQPVLLADVPGRQQVHGERHAVLAEDEAARAHVLVYVADADLTRTQDADLRILARFDRPLLLVLNKQDRYDRNEREALRRNLQVRYAPLGIETLAVSAGFTEQVTKEWPDGRRSVVERQQPAEVSELQRALLAIAGEGPQRFEVGRQHATVAQLDSHIVAQEREVRDQAAERIVSRYTRRAMVAAMASVAPGTDLLLQGALATALAKELAALHRLRLRDLDVDALMSQASRIVRTRTGIVLAIAGNALKAFPGIGTLGGGVMHAVAYGLIFDSLGRSMNRAFADTGECDRSATLAAFEASLGQDSGAQLTRVTGMVRQLLDAEPPSPASRLGGKS